MPPAPDNNHDDNDANDNDRYVAAEWPSVVSRLLYPAATAGPGLRGSSHSHLVLIAEGHRVPSREVAEAIIRVFDLDDDVADELLDAAVVREPSPSGRGRVVRGGP